MLDPPEDGIEEIDFDVSAQFVPIWVKRGLYLKNVDESIREDSQIDQRHLYQSEESARSWYAFLHDEDYRQYGECVSSLRTLLGSRKWEELSAAIDGAVMLGAGTESKDRIIVNHLHQRFVASNKRFSHYIVDYSYHMLMPTVRGLERHISELASGVTLQRPIIANFCQLPSDFPRISPTEHLAWFLPGGTLGNLEEDEFFESMSRVMHDGDLLIIGVETIGGDLSAVKESLQKKYDTAVLRRFVSTPIRAYWFAKDMNFDLPSAIKNARIDIVEGAKDEKHLRGHSHVENALSVVISVSVEGQQVTVLFSTRYDQDKLIEYATAPRFGFSIEHEVASKESPNYKQFVFRKNGRAKRLAPTEKQQ